MTTYYERHGYLYKLEVGDNVLDYIYARDGEEADHWVNVFDTLTRWIMFGDADLDQLTAEEAEAKYPGSTGGTT